ncbi:MAG: glutamine--tRNA ligase/YqeY domain fusion protein [Firmicutes bacterium]|nr:glutamine--tRNA ligase/YqeY domain fusion protein [Bacillota bacterium]
MEIQSNFIKTIMEEDIKNKKVDGIITRFPPEPNAYLHIGHARAIVTNFELARQFDGYTNLRFDDTNPVKEDSSFVDAIKEDIKWLGYTPNNILFGSDYFEQTYELAVRLIQKGVAYVCDLSQEQVSSYRGTLTEPGKESPYRNRSVEENLLLFKQMRDGKFKDGEKTLRAKIDMSSPNINLRDPVIYRIIHITHHNTGDKWCIYPMYDFAHPLQDSIEGVTHSLCSLEYVDHRVLYDWFVEQCEMPHIPHQYEFGRLNITNTIMSKRYLKQLVEKGVVKGYDDPRMPTLAGLRRRGYTSDSIKSFILSTGLSRINSTVSSEMLENSLRNDLVGKTKRVYAILDPIKLIITNYPDQTEAIDLEYNPENLELGSRILPFGKEVYIERTDFIEEKPNKHWKRLSLGIEVRLMHAYFIKCNEVIYNEDGSIKELLATYDVLTKSGSGFNERKPNGNIHFVEAKTALPATFNLFEPLMVDSDSDRDMMERLNPNSWKTVQGFIEPSVGNTFKGERFQFVREGYFATDYDSKEGNLIFNRIVELKSSYN